MEYPGAIITRPVRIALLIFFIAIFCLAAPLVILYTAGYRYDWANGLLKETGSISIDILPRDAVASLNGLKLKGKMPIRLKNISRGKHLLRLSASGYYDWEKELELKGKQSIYIKDIQMIRKETPRLIAEGAIDSLSLSPSGEYLMYSIQRGKQRETRILTFGNQDDSLIVVNTERLTGVWAPKNSFVAISEENPPFRHLLIVEAGKTAAPIAVDKKAPGPIEKFVWRESVSPQLYFSASATIFSFTPLENEPAAVAPNHYLDWHLNSDGLWTLNYATSTGQLIITRDALGFSSRYAEVENNPAFSTNSVYLENSKDGTVLLSNRQGALQLLTPERQFRISGQLNLISRYNNWWLLWTPWELWTYAAGDEPRLLNRSGEELRQVMPLDKFNTLALVWANKTTVLFPYYLINHDLLPFPIHSLAADSERRILYFSGAYKGKEGLWKLAY